jgi:hypothetical protein
VPVEILPRQLTLAGFESPAPPGAAAAPRVYVRGVSVDRAGIAQYLHIIRAVDDPERSPRPLGGRKDRAPHRTLAETPIPTCEAQILGLLGDGVPRTFNRIGVELLDHTADTLMGSPYDNALWNLVDRAELEHTLDAPILFRVRSDARRFAGVPCQGVHSAGGEGTPVE